MVNTALKISESLLPLSGEPTRPIAFIPYTLIACLNQHRELFMVKRTKPPFVGRWNFIGGKIEVGETPASAAIRELHEEASRHASPKRLSFRGIALWPDTSDVDQYLGMFMFRFYDRIGKAQSKQLGLLHEGVTAWISLDLLFGPSEFKAVPNFELIATQILEPKNCPAVLCHEVDGDVVRVLWSHSMRAGDHTIVSQPYISPKFRVADLLAGD
jgi:8-oxo-dGTP diphosphatase